MTALVDHPTPVTTPAGPATTPAGPFTRPRSRRPDRRRWQDGPTPASLADLVALTREVAAEVAVDGRAGRHDVTVDPVHRWSRRLHADEHLDVWLISWTTDQAAELHDHGGSLGALTVVRGALTEWRWSPGSEDDGTCAAEEIAARGPGLRRRVVDPGRSVAFGLGHVHDVSNRAVETAVSVHAYSPPLSAMSYYAVEGGVLRRTRSELVAPGESPE
ncbi:cysteine dioxygenase [Actinomycetospora straminea]|uniref:Cysteine dioxygenase family protein n=1 Tax=Actinomycetospora straminea TaxID=663607 RepID=A0ABP9F2E2_9PSEU|nr:cysteine dioxygenase family protein [Actinomycetospora straminea]MDD7934687.1 cysteine dioxygenase family protein [Actinomycetospora straminea]